MNFKRPLFLFVLAGILAFPLYAQLQLDHIEPPLWWTGMKNPELTILFHGNAIAQYTPVVNYPGVTIKTVTRTDNPNCLFVNLYIDSTAAAGKVPVYFMTGKKNALSYLYELKKREKGSSHRESFGTQDVIYLLMPDRFANGDTTNDSVTELAEKVNRNNPNGRHGGDIQGIIDRLDYLKDLGITALWTTPLLEDNQAEYSYHTYAITDYFKIDSRYGSNKDYVRLSQECHKRGIKLIMDMVPNHCGSAHWWMKNPPMKDWFHQFPEFTRTNYTISVWNDPHAAQSDILLNKDGWFDVSMPDLNQNNPFLLTYFKQFAIFWMEYAGLDGIRVDTYPYNDKWKIADWTAAIRHEYPKINIMGECWQHRPSEIAYWQSGVSNYDRYDSQLPTVMDFPLNDAFMDALNEKNQSWDKGASRFYNVYIMDYLYARPDNLLIFMDNHDTQRFSEQIGFNEDKFKLAVTHLLTTRGIPQIYYGTEIMMGGKKSAGDGDIRKDFPGGWPGDERNAFTAGGRNTMENNAFDYMKTLLNYRKNNTVIHSGRLIQFIPRDNVYVYFRINSEKTLMIILNLSEEERKIDSSRYKECLGNAESGKEIVSGEILDVKTLNLKGKSSLILEIQQK